ncbi:LOW QUALITY PROTEIN: forkhead box protein D1-like [Sorghum bicolor]|uniref:LOW QUALITY PROTEIN: forkhead box protein D1-like n=1 Tax=Sorghum bicolor TaxID=4558 RepID=UPI000B424179|nr:LOW QUALITY PROTEIN: forkhead box protein D1-like [Sorghum bicolor]|eukprot:XP_021319318.1 LOW QUALITY PROTEIN: forkhead box protein D1-like [Sorghum bicolor]
MWPTCQEAQACGPPVRKLQEVVLLLGPSSASETVRSREPVAAAVAGLLPRGCAAPPAAPPTRRTAASSSCPRGPSPPLPRPPAGPLIGAGKGATVAASSFLSPALVAKLHRFNLASVQVARGKADAASAAAASAPAVLPRIAAMAACNATVGGIAPSPSSSAAGGFLEEQYVDQMIEELVDSNFSMEIPREVA